MILSHKYKFFFLRSRKVAGSSILYNLGKHCGDKDVVNSPDAAIALCNKIRGTNFQSVKKNFHIIDPDHADKRGRDHPDWVLGIDFPRIHISPSELAVTFPKEWKTYAKIGAVRNPFDMVYSMWSYEQILKPDKPHLDFNDWIARREGYLIGGLGKQRSSLEFWFDHETGLPIKYDFMIKYENLDNDYKNVCQHFGIPYEPLVKLNASTRFNDEDFTKYKNLYGIKRIGNDYQNKSYRNYYNDASREFIGTLYAKLLERYNYEF